MDRHNPLRRLAAPNGMSGEDLVHKKERCYSSTCPQAKVFSKDRERKRASRARNRQLAMTRTLPLISFNTVLRSIAMSSDLCKHNYELI